LTVNPYAPPRAAAPGSTSVAPWRLLAWRGAAIVVACEAARSVGWRLSLGLAQWMGGWSGAFVVSRVIKLIGAAAVLWGAWVLTREPVPASPPLRAATRLLVIASVAGSAARLLLAAAGIIEYVSEPVSMGVDALAMVACAACCAHLLRSVDDPRGAHSAWVCSAVYVVATALRALVLVLERWNGASGLISFAMIALGVWGWRIASRLRARP